MTQRRWLIEGAVVLVVLYGFFFAAFCLVR